MRHRSAECRLVEVVAALIAVRALVAAAPVLATGGPGLAVTLGSLVPVLLGTWVLMAFVED